MEVWLDPQGKRKLADMAPLIKRVRGFVDQRRKESTIAWASVDVQALAQTHGFTERRKGKPEMILADDVAVELGHPSTASRATLLTTFQPELVKNGQITIVGPDLPDVAGENHHPFVQIVMLAIDPGKVPDPFELDNTQYLMHRLPGYMVRSIPGKLWVRVSQGALTRGLTLKTVGSALIAAYSREFEGIKTVESLFVTSDLGDVLALERVGLEANILAGRHRKLALTVDGEVECVVMNCGSCEEKPVCDNLRDIVIKRRERSK